MVNIANLKNITVPKAVRQEYIKKAEAIMQSPIKALPVKPDVIQMTPEVKKGIKEGIKKFDNPTLLQKTRRFLSKNKIGAALMFAAMALIALASGKKIADDIEEKVQ